jgi:hypothetical protein
MHALYLFVAGLQVNPINVNFTAAQTLIRGWNSEYVKSYKTYISLLYENTLTDDGHLFVFLVNFEV